MPPILLPFMLGVTTAPLTKRAMASVARGAIKGSVRLAKGVQDLSQQSWNEVRSTAAEAKADSGAVAS
ncbi:hypothetical protein RKD23_007523 [Streptomyces sp. SAI-170]